MNNNKTDKKQINVYLVGNPNSGKTSLFNAITGERRKVGNWPGVTVQRIQGITETPLCTLKITDLPGTYSLTPATPEEKIVLNALDEAVKGVVLNVVDIANFERNLFLTTQLVELGLRPVLSLNCFDSFTSAGGTIDLKKFKELSGCSPFPTVARSGEGVTSLKEHMAKSGLQPGQPDTTSALDLPPIWKEAANSLLKTNDSSWTEATPLEKYRALGRLTSTKIDEEDLVATKIRNTMIENLNKTREHKIKAADLACELATDRYKRIERVIEACAQVPAKNIPAWQEKLDDFLTHRFFGLPLFALMMAFVFWTTFWLGEIPMGYMASMFEFLGSFLEANMAESLLRDLLTGGIIEGIGGILVFLPNILILFFWIALLEDSGYMSRAAFIMDRMMNSIGLHGRAFIPMIMGIGCNVPAVMATRIIDNRFQRLLTMLLIPLITCAARLPVLVLLCGTFFPENPSLWMFMLFFLNLLVIVFLGHISSLAFSTKENSPFLLEMPPYRLPTPKSVGHMLYEKCQHFIEKAGTVILAGAILIWVLSVFPREVNISFDYEAELAALKSQEITTEITDQIAALARRRDIEEMEGRYMARIGKAIHPIMRPLGFSWRETVALIPGFLAKESVVSTLGVLYLPFNEDLGAAMKSNGMNKITAFVFMLFTLLYIPCIATLGVVWRESGSTKFTIMALFVYFALAYVISFVVLQIATLMLSQYDTVGISAHEVIILIIISLAAFWYLFKTFVSALTGKKCSGCAAAKHCQARQAMQDKECQ